MAEFTVLPRFSFEWSEWEKTASPRDLEELDRAMAAIALDPALPGRFRSYYDPIDPTFLYRIENVIIHYRIAADGAVEFVNLFPR